MPKKRTKAQEEELAKIKARMMGGAKKKNAHARAPKKSPSPAPKKRRATPKKRASTPKRNAPGSSKKAKTPPSSGKRGTLRKVSKAEELAELQKRMGGKTPAKAPSPAVKTRPKRTRTPSPAASRRSRSPEDRQGEIDRINERMGRTPSPAKAARPSPPPRGRRSSSRGSRRQSTGGTGGSAAPPPSRTLHLLLPAVVAILFYYLMPSLPFDLSNALPSGAGPADPFKVLGLEREDVRQQPMVIVQSYRKLAKRFHPDKSSDNADKFLSLHEAYGTLKSQFADELEAAKKEMRERDADADNTQVVIRTMDPRVAAGYAETAVTLHRERNKFKNMGLGAVIGFGIAYSVEQFVRI